MCSMGEMNAWMIEIVKLFADALLNIRESMIQTPDIYIILNMLAEKSY